MENKSCAKCQKQVYPVERLDVLDRVWHKGCFACEVCGMKLTMKTYVALDKIPYCKAHYPKQQASTIADTPEMLRLQQNTKNQSKAVYTADYQKKVHEYTSIPDQPEVQRLMNNMKVISNAHYHGGYKQSSNSKRPENIESVDGATYEAQQEYLTEADDEVALSPGDIILNAIVAAEGWLQGTNDRTGKSGFLPEAFCKKISS